MTKSMQRLPPPARLPSESANETNDVRLMNTGESR